MQHQLTSGQIIILSTRALSRHAFIRLPVEDTFCSRTPSELYICIFSLILNGPLLIKYQADQERLRCTNPPGIEFLGRLDGRGIGTKLVDRLHPLIVRVRVEHDSATCINR